MTQTLRRELRQRFLDELDSLRVFSALDIDKLAERLADAAIDVSAIKKKGDILEGMRHFDAIAKERGEDKVEQIIQELEQGLHVNIDRSLKNQQAAKRIIRDGRPIIEWLAWCKSDEWRNAHLNLYRSLDKIWGEWPQAWATAEKKEHISEYRTL